jgi:serine protease Do
MTRRHPLSPLFSALAALAALSVPSISLARADDVKQAPAAAMPAVLDKPAPENLADLKAMEQQVKKVLDKVIPCTVNIRDTGGQGSGVIVSDDGYVLTAGHVSREANREVQVTLPDGRKVKAKTLGANHFIDSGFLKITDPPPAPGKWPHAELGKSADLKKGQWVVTTGHPGGWKEGRSPVVRLGRVLQASPEMIRTDCTIVGGDSGGPLFDMNGKVIGIHSRISFSLASNIHVPVDTYRTTWDRLVKGEIWGNGYLGFAADRKAKGCRVEEVRKDSPAEKAGLKPDDIILKFDGKKVETFDQFGERLREAAIGAVIPLEVERGEEVVTIKVTIGKRDINLPGGPMEATKDELTKNGGKVLTAFRDAAAKARSSTVKVLCDGKDTALGTVVGPDGWVLTKLSELKGKTTCKLADGRDLEAQIVGVQEVYDLALLKIDARGLTAVEWQESKVAPVGNWVASAGLAVDPIAVGVVSVGVRKGNPKEARPARDPAQTGYLGITLAPIEGGGIKIDQVMPDQAAARAGIKPNDVVLSLNGKAIKDVDEFINAVGGYKPKEVITLKIKRGTEEKEIKATLGTRPPDRGDIQNNMGGSLSLRRAGFPSFLQHDTILKPQDCGGPVVDLDGKVIGINIARAGRTESYAIPSEAVQPLLFDLMSGKLAPKAVTVSAPPTAAERVAAAKAALQKAEADKTVAEKKVAELKAALEKAEADLKREKENASKTSK